MSEHAVNDRPDGAPPGSSVVVDNLLRPVMIAGMLACLTAPLVLLLQWLGLGYNANYFMIFAFLASLEGILSERVLQRRRVAGWAYLASRLSEALLLLVLLKLSTYISLGYDQLLADAQTWVTNPYSFFSALDLFLGTVFLLMWGGSLYVARMTRELDVTELKSAPPEDRTSAQYYMWLTTPTVVRDRQETLAWLTEVVLWGGIVLLLASAAVHFLVESAGVLAVPAMLYFALAIALLTQARFSVTQSGWQAQGIESSPEVARRWLLWVVLFLLAMSLVALILPTYYTLGPLQACLGALGVLYAVLSFVMSFILFLFTLPFYLLSPNADRPTPPPLEIAPQPTPDAAIASTSPPWLEILGSAIFWVVVLAILGYALVRFLRDRVGGPEDGEPAEDTLWGRFRAWLNSLWQRLWAWRQGLRDELALRRAARGASTPLVGRLSRLFSPRRLPPREMVRFFYLSAARRASQAGQPRRSGQTPYEYQDSLDERFPELEPDLEGLTGAFIEARYAPRPVDQEDVAAVKPLWQRVKAALRRHRRTQPPTS
jgi:hypothetical protein